MENYASFVKPRELIEAIRGYDREGPAAWYRNQTRIEACWLIDEAVYRHVLPPCFEPVLPLVYMFVADFGTPAANLPNYREGCLMILGKYGDVTGPYCLSMPVDGSDMGIFLGRENYSYPKKLARVALSHLGSRVHGWCERSGIRFVDISAEAGEPNTPDWYNYMPDPVLNTRFEEKNFLVDFKVGIEGEEGQSVTNWEFGGLKLMYQKNTCLIHSSQVMKVTDLRISYSPDDPWFELAPPSPDMILGARLLNYDTRMQGTHTLLRFDEEGTREMEPWLFNRYDSTMFGARHDYWRPEGHHEF